MPRVQGAGLDFEIFPFFQAGLTQGTTTLFDPGSNSATYFVNSLNLTIEASAAGGTAKVTSVTRDVFTLDSEDVKNAEVFYGNYPQGYPIRAGEKLQLEISGANPTVDVSGIITRKVSE